ncbi:Tye7p NDAI_0E03920 [Naumovozyma dairenensis CBS 421]|uniref:BHLH domain-containing protein n=1 Tax=Naumovozyma dairenensis (strain ATCC 10597 / BCRC 20456 / CBS 421 / NBRC 0211 / NRRL Y-12639) TaxID=1071378 RepID=G0WBT9_NAUDC|nr:hypothetical protein NDAI_0E03920 [Naumovozyma dairenensis CBS 421]CCD25209.1 hypothetical protein NDAI_0E03920 [Naumovozyma dairenensis CBS 421]
MNTAFNTATTTAPMTEQISNTTNFNSWMFQPKFDTEEQEQEQDDLTTPHFIKKEQSSTSLSSSSSSSWFEPLENILSSTSASTSSMGSPLDENQFNLLPNLITVKKEKILPSTSTSNSNNTSPFDYDACDEETDFFFNSLANTNNNNTAAAGAAATALTASTEEEEDETTIKKQLQQSIINNSNKKRCSRKRLTPDQKQAHNKIEKKYRININTKIAKLQHIIPWVASEKTAFEVGDSMKLPDSTSNDLQQTLNSTGANTKLNKSMILEKAVDYILYLQNNERLYELEVQRLKKEIESLKQK